MLAFWNKGHPVKIDNPTRAEHPNGTVIFYPTVSKDNDIYELTEDFPDLFPGEKLGGITYKKTRKGVIEAKAKAIADEEFDLDAFKITVQRMVDVKAEELRSVVLTPGQGQLMSYQLKTREAEHCLANFNKANLPEAGTYPILESEVPAIRANVYAVAELVIAQHRKWLRREAEINRVRMTAKRAIVDLTSGKSVQIYFDTLDWGPSLDNL